MIEQAMTRWNIRDKLRQGFVIEAWTVRSMERKRPSKRFLRWFLRKQKRDEPFRLTDFSTNTDYGKEDGFSLQSPEMNPHMTSSELRIFVGTWNVAGRSPVGSLAVDLHEWLKPIDAAADIYVLGFQEIVPLKTSTVIGSEDSTEATNWNLLIGKTLNGKDRCPWTTPVVHPITDENDHCEGKVSKDQQNHLSRYILIASKKMVGVFISVWIRRELVNRCDISHVKVCSVACGMMGYLGNKGSVSVSMSVGRTTFCFIAAHLASGEKKGDEHRRNHQVSEIFRRTFFSRRFSEVADKLHPLTIFGHDRIFWFGDLNYRLYLEDNLARELIKEQDWRALQKFDQLQRELGNGRVFQGWKEGNIDFAPTYKYSTYNCNRYSGGSGNRAFEKQRTPAWCDRILWYGEGVRQLSYFRSESKFSDHRPVSALFSTQIVDKTANTNPVTPTKTLRSKTAKEDSSSTLRSLILKDM